MQNQNLKKKNILYIFNDTGFGGAGQSLLDTLEKIRKDVNPIIVIREDAAVEYKFNRLNIRCYKIPFVTDFIKIGNANLEEKQFDQWQSYKAALMLLPILKKERIDLIHINSSVSYFGAIAALMAHIPYIWHIRELMEEQFNSESLNDEIKKKLYEQADGVITISNYVHSRYQKKYGICSKRIYNGLDIERFKKQIKKEKKFKNIFLLPAMITPEKRQWDAIRAVEILIKKGYEDIKLIIIGGGPFNYIWALKKYIVNNRLEKNICILPFCDDLSQYRELASYAITCSQNEALGRVTIEAMLAGNIVIGARSGGTTEIIGSKEERGFLYELGNSDQLADTMIRAIECPDEMKILLSYKAQLYAEETFSSNKYCEKLLKLYREIISRFVPQNSIEILKDIKECYISYVEKSKKHDTSVLCIKKSKLYEIAVKWLEIRQKGHSLAEYFTRNNIYNIAIYGMGTFGCYLYDELDKSNIEIRYLIDRNPNGMNKIFKFSSLKDEQLDICAIVVTVVLEEQDIINELYKMGYKKIIGLTEILDTLYVAINSECLI